ncbi:MAG TPA: hypothetical protein VGD75_11420 [Bradyrhizobium sp.]
MAYESTAEVTGDAREQIRQLRDQVDTLMRDRVRPMVADAAERASDAATKARDIAEDQIDAWSDRVSDHPITSVLLAAVAGYLLGRITR